MCNRGDIINKEKSVCFIGHRFKIITNTKKTWTITEIEQLKTHQNKAFKVIYTQGAYSRGCYYKRDRQLVDISSVYISYQYTNSGALLIPLNTQKNIILQL